MGNFWRYVGEAFSLVVIYSTVQKRYKENSEQASEDYYGLQTGLPDSDQRSKQQYNAKLDIV